jgi:hypothetical protein
MRVLETQANAYSILGLGKIAPQAAVLRVKYSVLPSGANVDEPSFAGPEIIPGENGSGVTAALLDAVLCWCGIAEPFRTCKD